MFHSLSDEARHLFDVFGYRIFPVFWAVVFVSIPIFSAVPPHLWVIQGHLATATIVTYGLVLALLGLGPLRFSDLHPVGGALAVLVLVGRAGGFLELSIERGEWSLTAAILERLGYAAALVFWHRAGKQRAQQIKETKVWTN